jgi:hypothetical protein
LPYRFHIVLSSAGFQSFRVSRSSFWNLVTLKP